MNWLKNKSVLITGASDGVGREISKKIATVCSELILVASNRSGKLDTLYEEIKSLCQVRIFTADVRNYELSKQIVDSCVKIDSFIYCAGGTNKYGPIESFDKDEIQSIFDINIVALCQWLSLLLPKMKQNADSTFDKNGHVILLSSRSGERAMANLSVYAAAKGAVEKLCEGLQRECAKNSIVFTLVNPGSINTSFTSQWTDTQAVLAHNAQSMNIEYVIDFIYNILNIDCAVNKISLESVAQWHTELGVL